MSIIIIVFVLASSGVVVAIISAIASFSAFGLAFAPCVGSISASVITSATTATVATAIDVAVSN